MFKYISFWLFFPPTFSKNSYPSEYTISTCSFPQNGLRKRLFKVLLGTFPLNQCFIHWLLHTCKFWKHFIIMPFFNYASTTELVLGSLTIWQFLQCLPLHIKFGKDVGTHIPFKCSMLLSCLIFMTFIIILIKNPLLLETLALG